MAEEKLSKRQQKAMEEYLVLDEQLRSQGYHVEKKTVSILKANLYAMLIAGPFALLGYIIYNIIYWGNPGLFESFYSFLPGKPIIQILLSLLLLLGAFILLIFLHELTHAFFWGLCTGNRFMDVELGMMWSSLTPYCHCKTPLKMWQMRLGAFMPFITTGLVPYIIGMFLGSVILVTLACFMMLCAGGDLTILWIIRRLKGDLLVIDHPSECGCYVYEKKNH